tara:strand:+ start:2435 stop:2770 length:336 start_codon:yes stop_codon:yes gene_type:complete
MAFKIKRFIPASPLTMPDPDPKDPKKKKVIARKTKEKITPPAAKTQLDKLDILARRYPGYVHRPPRDYGYSSTNKKGNPNEYRLYNAKTGDSMTVYPDFGQNRKKNKQIDK